jgi:hypothetical protein
MERKLTIADGASVGAWIGQTLGGEFGSVGRHVPRGYEAYARVFHPARDDNGRPVKWAEVASVSGAIPHREMQWYAILGLSEVDQLEGYCKVDARGGTKWVGYDPPAGGMDDGTLDAMCGIIGDHTHEFGQCYFGLCVIQGWLKSFPVGRELLLSLCARDYVVLQGPLMAVDQLEYDSSQFGSSERDVSVRRRVGEFARAPVARFPQRGAPNLIWPANRSWFVASEVDFDSTLVGGNSELIEAMIESPELEAWRVGPTDSLAADGDKINGANE